MLTFSQNLVSSVHVVRQALTLEPAIRPDLSAAGLSTVISVIFALMLNGTTHAPAIQRYLEDHRCPFDRQTVQFLLDAYNGFDPELYLWMEHPVEGYSPAIDVLWAIDANAELIPADV